MRIYFIIIIGLCSCNYHNNSSEEVVSYLNGSDKAVKNVIDISIDSILAIKQNGSVIFSKDTGRTWTEIQNLFPFDDLTFTSDHVLVGIDSWIGYHEEPYSRMYISYDFGKTWNTTEYPTDEFFPVKIISDPKNRLMVQTEDNRVYQLSGPDFLKDWQFKYDGKDEYYDNEAYDSVLFADNSNNRNVKLYRKTTGRADTLARLDSCQHVLSIISEPGYIYISGTGVNVSSGTRSYFAYLHEGRLKKHLFPGENLYLKRTHIGRIYLLGEAGLYLVSNGILNLLYQ